MTAIATIAAAPILAAIAIEDLRHHRIRNHCVLALAAVTAAVVLVAVIDGDGKVVGRATLGAVLASAPLAAAWITQPGRVGGGDVKLAAALGALVGTASAWLAIAVVALGLTVSLFCAVAFRRQRVPLAPALTAAAVLVATVSASASG
jgi:leader peptidase (prepilin peptidase) / N-methyltransferase